MRPEIVTDEHLEFLDRVREKGMFNMLSIEVVELMVMKFWLTLDEAKEIRSYWVTSFGDKNR